jgi:flagellar basal-body rod protein FlgB
MFLNNSFGKTLNLLHRSMDADLMRNSIIANNIANAETDHFKRSELNFESSLKAALDSEKKRPALQAKMSSPRHIPFNEPVDYRTVKPKKTLDFQTTSKNNGNNVDIEVEAANQLENMMHYTLVAELTKRHINQVNMVLR